MQLLPAYMDGNSCIRRIFVSLGVEWGRAFFGAVRFLLCVEDAAGDFGGDAAASAAAATSNALAKKMLQMRKPFWQQLFFSGFVFFLSFLARSLFQKFSQLVQA